MYDACTHQHIRTHSSHIFLCVCSIFVPIPHTFFSVCTHVRLTHNIWHTCNIETDELQHRFTATSKNNEELAKDNRMLKSLQENYLEKLQQHELDMQATKNAHEAEKQRTRGTEDALSHAQRQLQRMQTELNSSQTALENAQKQQLDDRDALSMLQRRVDDLTQQLSAANLTISAAKDRDAAQETKLQASEARQRADSRAISDLQRGKTAVENAVNVLKDENRVLMGRIQAAEQATESERQRYERAVQETFEIQNELKRCKTQYNALQTEKQRLQNALVKSSEDQGVWDATSAELTGEIWRVKEDAEARIQEAVSKERNAHALVKDKLLRDVEKDRRKAQALAEKEESTYAALKDMEKLWLEVCDFMRI
jgi:predicted  nucleic acid-binding Zn-ribbon protein